MSQREEEMQHNSTGAFDPTLCEALTRSREDLTMLLGLVLSG
jgi:hypothetical protein